MGALFRPVRVASMLSEQGNETCDFFPLNPFPFPGAAGAFDFHRLSVR